MTTLVDRTNEVGAVDVVFVDDKLVVALDDGREISLPLAEYTWLDWLRLATPEQRAAWSLEPGGFAIYWDQLDDGVEVRHLLGLTPLT